MDAPPWGGAQSARSCPWYQDSGCRRIISQRKNQLVSSHLWWGKSPTDPVWTEAHIQGRSYKRSLSLGQGKDLTSLLHPQVASLLGQKQWFLRRWGAHTHSLALHWPQVKSVGIYFSQE